MINLFIGGILSHQSPLFHEEFPRLAPGGEEEKKEVKEEAGKDIQYGPGPSLRPQSMMMIFFFSFFLVYTQFQI